MKANGILKSVNGTEVSEHVLQFRKRIQNEMVFTGNRNFAFPGGERANGDNYEILTKNGQLSITIISDDLKYNRYFHFVTLDQHDNTVSSDLEINVPKVPDARISTIIASNERNVYLCNRGRVTVFMRTLKVNEVLSYFLTQHNNVTQVNDNRKLVNAIVFADLSSPELFDQIALFTSQMKAFKARYS